VAVARGRHKAVATSVVARLRKAVAKAVVARGRRRRRRGRRWRGVVAHGRQHVVRAAARWREQGRGRCNARGRRGRKRAAEGERVATKARGERAVASGEKSYMTGGPRGFPYRRLIRRLGFKHRLIASV
jgi:hypothetical protein